MVAEAIVRESAYLVCNCSMLVGVRRSAGVVGAAVMPRRDDLRVRAGAWDCPSCGLDKRHALAEMVKAAGAWWLMTWTFEQPRAFDRDGVEVMPAEHALCRRSTHVYVHVDSRGRRSARWRTVSTCRPCMQRVSWMRHQMVKRIRRMFPEFGYLDVIEDHKNGALHLHFAVVGVPLDIDQAAVQLELRRHWKDLGGGRQVDLKAPPGQQHAGALGWYLGKYLAKRQEQRMAQGHRRWGRSHGFASDVLMAWSQKWRERYAVERGAVERGAVERPAVEVLGWWHPILRKVGRSRVWLDRAPPDPVASLRAA